jgi:hypothetical protein
VPPLLPRPMRRLRLDRLRLHPGGAPAATRGRMKAVMTRPEAAALVQAETCTWQCLFARELVCICRCDGQYHGRCPRPKPRYRVQPSRKLWVWLLELQRDDIDDEWRAKAARFARGYIAQELPTWEVPARAAEHELRRRAAA